jgi:hypothetical protein
MKTLTNLVTKKAFTETMILVLGAILIGLAAYEIVIVGRMAQ